MDFRPSLDFKASSLNHSDNLLYDAVFGGNGKTQFYSGGVSSIIDLLQTIIGNILRSVDFVLVSYFNG